MTTPPPGTRMRALRGALRETLAAWAGIWIADDPYPQYSALDRKGGLESPRIPQSPEVEQYEGRQP